MLKNCKFFFIPILFFTGVFFLSAHLPKENNPATFKMPYKKAGLTDRQAAAHLIDRFTFGVTPGEVDEVVKTGLEEWFADQLDGQLNDDSLNNQLKQYDALDLSNAQVLEKFPRQARILKEAMDAGVISKDSADKSNKALYKDKLQAYMDEKGYRPQKELFRQLINQKVLSAAYSNNQLQQVLTEFWFNHFNVSLTKNDCAPFIPAYERDAIRPNVAGKFGDLLLATAQSPAMLFYLDNFSSTGNNDEMDKRRERLQQRMNKEDSEVLQKINKRQKGLNENYAREIMELHTMGVDGGYNQQDVTEAARVLTGWTVFPISDYGPSKAIQKIIDKVGEDNLAARGFVHKRDFFFTMNRHDTKEKNLLGKNFAAGGGYREGVELINMLAHHPSTAKFISKKLAIRFVSDNPPASLVDRMATTFTKSNGDIRQVLITMVSSAEFWDKEALREKTKSPLELAISAVRALDAQVKMPFILYQWISKMGQNIYYYQAPTGFPDKAQYWINTGSLLNRMNFGLAFAAQKIPGVSFSLSALNNNHEPESAEAALVTYSKLMMPERDMSATIKRLTPLINDPEIQNKINDAAVKSAANKDMNAANGNEVAETMETTSQQKELNESTLAKQSFKKGNNRNKEVIMASAPGNNTMLAQVVGIILGSPEFQRR